ncbi:MAG: HlyC/CorC family transporter [Clostridia bacterium]|nr:HlyC/CorC family transporter [Clostridia bacterium]
MSDPDPASTTISTVLLTLAFLLLTVLFHLADEAFNALGEIRIRELEENGNKKARCIRRITEKERQFSSRIRMSCLLFGILAAATLLHRFASPISGWLGGLFGGILGAGLSATLACVLLSLLTVFVFITFGCLLPRRLVYINIEAVALAVVRLFVIFYGLLRPLYGLCALVTGPFLRMAGIDPHEDPDTVTEDDIRQLMDAGEEIGAIEGSQKDMVNNIFEFDDITAEEIMTPRTDMTAVEVDTSLPDVLAVAVENGYSRIPVYEEDIDHIIGILYIKDLLPFVGQTLPADTSVRSLLREAYFVPDTKRCNDLFEEMNEKHLQMAIVVDEYGGVAGIVTMEDLLESIVGNIQDEFDDEKEAFTQLDENSFAVDGSLSIGDLGELLEMELPEGDYDTVAGFVLDLLGDMPEQDEAASVSYKNITLTIQKMDDRRIEEILVHRDPCPEEEDTQDDA